MPDPATARRIIFGTYVVPQESLITEEGVTKYAIEGGTGKTYGSKGIVSTTADQWSEAWTSMQHTQQYWEDYGNNWDDAFDGWSNSLTISSARYLIKNGLTTTVKFLYIRNLGTDSDQGLALSIDETNYKIYIPPNGSISLRGDSVTPITIEDILVNKVTSSTDIEYIVAT